MKLHQLAFRIFYRLSSVQWKGPIQSDSNPEVHFRRKKKQKEPKSYEVQKEEEEAK